MKINKDFIIDGYDIIEDDAKFYAYLENKYRNLDIETVTIDDCESIKELCFILRETNFIKPKLRF